MKNIITITLVILILLLGGYLLVTFMPSGKDLSYYLPQSISISDTTNYIRASIDARLEPYTVTLGPSDDNSVDFEVVSMQGDYFDSEGRMAMTIIAQELKADQIETYKEKAWERFTEPSRGGAYEQDFINGYDVYVSFRDLEEDEDTSGMFILGSGYVFIPEESTVLTFSLFNTRLYACETVTDPTTCLHDQEKVLPTIETAKSIAETLTGSLNTE